MCSREKESSQLHLYLVRLDRYVHQGQSFLFLVRTSLDTRHHSGVWLMAQASEDTIGSRKKHDPRFSSHDLVMLSYKYFHDYHGNHIG